MRNIVFVIAILLLGGICAFFWFIRKPEPIGVSANAVVSYQGSDQAALQQKYGKVLIVYYSLTGTTQEVALTLQQKTGGDLYRIQLKDEYPAERITYWHTRNQIKDNYLPALQEIKADLAQYDAILVGSPVWWYTTIPPLRSYLAQTDFNGKTVAPFCTQGGNEGKYFEDFAQRAKNASLKPGLNLKFPRKQDAGKLNQTIEDWLDKTLL